MRIVTRKQLKSRKAKAARFTRDVLGDPGRAAEIEDESLESYAERRGYQIQNPKGRKAVERRQLDSRLLAWAIRELPWSRTDRDEARIRRECAEILAELPLV